MHEINKIKILEFDTLSCLALVAIRLFSKYYSFVKNFILKFIFIFFTQVFIQVLMMIAGDELVIFKSLAAGGSCLEDNNCGPNKASCITVDDIQTNINQYTNQLGEYSLFIDGFSMIDPSAEGEIPAKGATQYSDGTPVVYSNSGDPLPLCNVPTNNVRFCYNPIGGSKQCKIMNSSDSIYFQGAFFQALNTGTKICVQVLGSLGWTTMGCKYSSYNKQPGSDYDKCYVSPSCADRAVQHSKGFFPLSAIIVECVKESVEKVMLKNEFCIDDTGKPKVNILPNMQNALRQAVKAALVLYVILFGIRTALGPNMPDKSEWFIFGMKMILVLYFSVGIAVKNKGVESYEDGLSKFIVPYSIAAANSLANIAFQAGGNKNLCKYTPCTLCKNCAGCVNYAQGYEYLSLWDSLDCRIAYYLMVVAPKDAAGVIGSGGVNTSVKLPVFKYNFLSLFAAAFLSFQIFFLILAICFAVLFISLCLFFIHTYVIALIAIGIMIYIAPIFIPMALFKPTKIYFDGWSRMLLSFIMQPMVISGFLALVLTVFDQAFYTNCVWNTPTTIDLPIVGTVPFFELSDNQPPLCVRSYGYAMARLWSGTTIITSQSAIFFDVKALAYMPDNIINGLLVVVLFSFLFYFFAESVSAIAADITGGPSLGGMAIGPTALANKIMDLVKKGIDVALAAFTVATAGAGAGVTAAAQAAKQAAQQAGKQAVRAGISAINQSVKSGVKDAAQSAASSTTNRGGNNNQARKDIRATSTSSAVSNVRSSSSSSQSTNASSSTVSRRNLSTENERNDDSATIDPDGEL